MGPFFVIDQSLKVNAARNQSHLKKELFHAVKKVYKKDDWVLKQYESLSHRPNILKGFLKETLDEGFLKSSDGSSRPEVLREKRCSFKFRKICRKTPVSESLFS